MSMFLQIKKYALSLAFICLLGFIAYHLLSKKPVSPNLTFTTIEGKNISMASLKGKVVLVNFWATDCTSCIKEMPDLINTYNAYKAKGFEVIAVAMPYDPPAQVKNYVTQKKLPFPVMHDGFGKITQSFGGVNVTPTTFLFDKEGNRLEKKVGILDFVNLHAILDRELS
jgi:thiol-disulfide isomerase/thioredoxin